MPILVKKELIQKGKEFAHREPNSFFLEWPPIDKGEKDITERGASPANVFIPLKHFKILCYFFKVFMNCK